MARATVRRLAALLAVLAAAASPQAQPSLTRIAEFGVPEAGQGVGVDARYFYAVSDTTLAKYDKRTGQLVTRWSQPAGGPLIHLDSAMVKDGRIYAAHSNYPTWPMTSSLEVFDADTLEHVDSHSFGIRWGSLTWVDFHDGFWWMTFANYDQPYGPGGTPYGHKAATQLIKFTTDFHMVEAWTLPAAILDKFDLMSNSGGSWGPDGFLYLTGHDLAELYRMRLPAAGSVLDLVATIPMAVRGQGIAWDRSEPGVIYGIVRATAAERAAGGRNKVVAFRLTP
ncbi:MAG: cycloisomerase [Vicinamibacterales bacterium]